MTQLRRTQYMPLDDVLRADRNAKRHDAGLIRDSMAQFGVVELPTVDDRTGKLVAGHGRLNEWERARESGEKPPDGVQVDERGVWLVPVVRGWRSRNDAEAEAYLLVSNRSTELGGWDDAELADSLQDMREADLLEVTGFDEADLARLLGDEPQYEPPPDSEMVDHAPRPERMRGVLVLADDDEQRELVYAALTAEGYFCRILD